jgi:hypothetical protein
MAVIVLCLCVQNASEPIIGVDRVERLSSSKVACREFVVSGKAWRDCYQKPCFNSWAS